MTTFVKSLLLFTSIFAAAYVARILIVPDAAPNRGRRTIELAS